MNNHLILSVLTGLTLLWLNADYIVYSKKAKKPLNKWLHYTIYLVAILNVFTPLVYILVAYKG